MIKKQKEIDEILSLKKYSRKSIFSFRFFFDNHAKNLRHVDENLNSRVGRWTVKAAIAFYK